MYLEIRSFICGFFCFLLPSHRVLRQGADNYLIDLDDRIFELIDFDITNDNLRDQVFERYMKIVDKTAKLEISELKQRGSLDAIAEDVYNELLRYKLELYTADHG